MLFSRSTVKWSEGGFCDVLFYFHPSRSVLLETHYWKSSFFVNRFRTLLQFSTALPFSEQNKFQKQKIKLTNRCSTVRSAANYFSNFFRQITQNQACKSFCLVNEKLLPCRLELHWVWRGVARSCSVSVIIRTISIGVPRLGRRACGASFRCIFWLPVFSNRWQWRSSQ